MSAIESSIIILTRNGEATIGECLEQVYTQNYTDFEVIVIDSASTDRTLDILSNFPVKVFNIKVEEFGHGKTRNYGAKLAKGKYLVYLTQDAIPFNENWLGNLLQNFNNKDVAGAYSRNVPKEGCDPFEARYITCGWGTEKQLKSIKDPANYKKRVFFSNTSSCIRKDVWEKIHFDDKLVQTEDQDWAKKVLEAGYKIAYDPASMVWHSHNNSPCILFRKYFDAGTAHKIIFNNNNNVYLPLIPLFSIVSTFLDLKFMLANDYRPLHIIRWIMTAFLRHSIEASGFWLGLHFNILPLSLKRKFTISGSY